MNLGGLHYRQDRRLSCMARVDDLRGAALVRADSAAEGARVSCGKD